MRPKWKTRKNGFHDVTGGVGEEVGVAPLLLKHKESKLSKETHKGPYLNDVYKIFWILDPHPLLPCLHSRQNHGTKFTQPPLLCLHLGTPSPCRRHLNMAP